MSKVPKVLKMHDLQLEIEDLKRQIVILEKAAGKPEIEIPVIVRKTKKKKKA